MGATTNGLPRKHSLISKASLAFICTPDVWTHSMPEDLAPRSSLARLPREVLSLIAYQLVVDDRGDGRHPRSLIPFLLTNRTIHNAISFDNNPQLYNDLFRATFDHAAMTRRYRWMQQNLAHVAGKGGQLFNLFGDPRSWANDYRTRWGQSSRMRQVAKHARLDLPGVCDKEQSTADLWNVWFLLTENDGKNLPFLVSQCHFIAWSAVLFKEDMLKDSLIPGYPKETGEKALAIWCALLAGTDHSIEETPADVDEKIFVMRPYVFACAKYDVTYAPWHHRRLPLCEPACKEHEPDVTMRSKALPYQRFGFTWRRAPPHFILGCYLVFLRLLEHQPGRMGHKPGSSTFCLDPADAARPGLFSTTYIMSSVHHDREWQRNTVCQDPHTSQGLPPLTFRGELQGYWRGKFLFYDFDHYRQVLAGNMRAVYTGSFAEQVAEMEFKETLIKIRKEEVGGNGPLLWAGFKEGEEDASEGETSIERGYGHEVVGDDEPDEEGWTKEILLSGRCRTTWGLARVRGRVRSWDGLVILSIAYSRHAMGRWLWRGYLHPGGNFIGRWRDTFTAESLRGYEGAFGMVRAGDSFYPSHFPQRMEDSLGMVRLGVPAQAGTVASAVGVPQMALPSAGSPDGMDHGEGSSSRGSVGGVPRHEQVQEGSSSGRDDLGSSELRDRDDEAEGNFRDGASEEVHPSGQERACAAREDASVAVNGIAGKGRERQQRDSALREEGHPAESPVNSVVIRGKKRERSGSGSE